MIRKPQNYKKTYVRKATYGLEFLDSVEMHHTKDDTITLDGDVIKLGSDRYKTFKSSGTKCVECGIEGEFFAKEMFRRGSDTKSYHMNLYAIDENGNEVLMTKDHIVPKIKGGPNHVSNYQTMCTGCNREKGSTLKTE